MLILGAVAFTVITLALIIIVLIQCGGSKEKNTNLL